MTSYAGLTQLLRVDGLRMLHFLLQHIVPIQNHDPLCTVQNLILHSQGVLPGISHLLHSQGALPGISHLLHNQGALLASATSFTARELLLASADGTR